MLNNSVRSVIIMRIDIILSLTVNCLRLRDSSVSNRTCGGTHQKTGFKISDQNVFYYIF